MERAVRGRPRLDLDLDKILRAVRDLGQIVGAARRLSCSPAYIHARLKEAGFTLADLVDGSPPPKSATDGDSQWRSEP